MDSKTIDLGRALRSAIESKGLIKKEVAKRCGKSPQGLDNILSQKDMKVSTLITVCRAIGVDVMEILK